MKISYPNKKKQRLNKTQTQQIFNKIFHVNRRFYVRNAFFNSYKSHLLHEQTASREQLKELE